MGSCNKREAAKVNQNNLAAAKNQQVQPIELLKPKADEVAPTNVSDIKPVKANLGPNTVKSNDPDKKKITKRTTYKAKKKKKAKPEKSYVGEEGEEDMEEELEDEDDPEAKKAKQEMAKTFPNKLNPSPDVVNGIPNINVNNVKSDGATDTLKTDTEFNSFKDDLTLP